jgi:hypothetical protein
MGVVRGVRKYGPAGDGAEGGVVVRGIRGRARLGEIVGGDDLDVGDG